VYLATGGGGFEKAAAYPLNTSASIASADFNGDGRPDLVIPLHVRRHVVGLPGQRRRHVSTPNRHADLEQRLQLHLGRGGGSRRGRPRGRGIDGPSVQRRRRHRRPQGGGQRNLRHALDQTPDADSGAADRRQPR
jgi:hypothetical protein